MFLLFIYTKGDTIDSKKWDQYAETYHEFIVSPFQKNVNNPLKKILSSFPDAHEHVIADFGCGPGDFLPFLATHFKKVIAVDFSPAMIDTAKKRYKSFKNIDFVCEDLRKISAKKIKVDVAVAVNSILIPDFKGVDKIISEIYSSLNSKGVFFGVFPAMEAIIHHSMLVYEHYRENNDKKKSLSLTRREVQAKDFNFIKGIYDDKSEQQKFFYRFEVLHRLEKAGFSKIKIKKVFYPWGTQGDFKNFESKPEMWDWYVIANKE